MLLPSSVKSVSFKSRTAQAIVNYVVLRFLCSSLMNQFCVLLMNDVRCFLSRWTVLQLCRGHLCVLDTLRFAVFSFVVCRWSLIHMILGQLPNWISKQLNQASTKQEKISEYLLAQKFGSIFFSPNGESVKKCSTRWIVSFLHYWELLEGLNNHCSSLKSDCILLESGF